MKEKTDSFFFVYCSNRFNTLVTDFPSTAGDVYLLHCAQFHPKDPERSKIKNHKNSLLLIKTITHLIHTNVLLFNKSSSS